MVTWEHGIDQSRRQAPRGCRSKAAREALVTPAACRQHCHCGLRSRRPAATSAPTTAPSSSSTRTWPRRRWCAALSGRTRHCTASSSSAAATGAGARRAAPAATWWAPPWARPRGRWATASGISQGAAGGASARRALAAERATACRSDGRGPGSTSRLHGFGSSSLLRSVSASTVGPWRPSRRRPCTRSIATCGSCPSSRQPPVGSSSSGSSARPSWSGSRARTCSASTTGGSRS
mmetsp:Transcript_42110/g.136298  ORF Transcript_42110/g.136298 Transcript_42110/m.136298 type:complete len:235 (+) Transcript_42110:370-1074(+)